MATGWAAARANRPDPAAGPRAMYDYAMARRIVMVAAGIPGDIRRYPSRFTFLSHIDDAAMFSDLYDGDHDSRKAF